jgi:hypothetical protein
MGQLGERLGERFADPDVWGRSWSFRQRSRPRLGVQLVQPTPELREHLGGDGEVGLLVSKVIADTPAEEAGIRVGDLIVAVDGEEIAGTGELRRALRERVGETFPIDVVRDGRPAVITVTLPEEDDEDVGPRAWLLPDPRVVPEVRVVLPDLPALPEISLALPDLDVALPALPDLPELPALPELELALPALPELELAIPVMPDPPVRRRPLTDV